MTDDTSRTSLERLAGLRAAAATRRLEDLTAGRVSALGWATVESDRAAAEFREALRVAPGLFAEAADVVLLGARSRVAPAALPDDVSLVLLEPFTEGRLAATLARLGEGAAVVWIVVDDLAGAAGAVQESGGHTSLARSGPFGPERLVLDGPIHGPHRLFVERPGTIRP